MLTRCVPLWRAAKPNSDARWPEAGLGGGGAGSYPGCRPRRSGGSYLRSERFPVQEYGTIPAPRSQAVVKEFLIGNQLRLSRQRMGHVPTGFDYRLNRAALATPAMAAICSGVVPQQPPMIRAPALMRSFTLEAMNSGVS